MERTSERRWVALYDGNCRICTKGAKQLRFLAGDRVDLRNFQDPSTLEGLPSIPYDDLMKEMYVVAPDDRIFHGAEAIARIATLAPVVGPLVYAYYLPGVKQLANAGYKWLAKRRYKYNAADCDGGTCKLHAHG